MVAVGCLYIKASPPKSRDILRDLVEMTKGVQHPTRGLFLRAYLCQRSRGLLPDAGSPYEGAGGDIHDAVDFLLTNFIEMNKLWVRMQHQGAARERERREKERAQLQDLVGKNLTYISQLDGLTFELYSASVLPRLLEQVRALCVRACVHACVRGGARARVGRCRRHVRNAVAAGRPGPHTAHTMLACAAPPRRRWCRARMTLRSST
jgi:hypothetical protein